MASSTASTGPDTPRVGGVEGGTAWVGGSNLATSAPTCPYDVLCYRPSGFKEMQKQHEELKKGLEDSQKLEIGNEEGKGISLTMWITWIGMMIITKGFDTIFKVCNVQIDGSGAFLTPD